MSRTRLLTIALIVCLVLVLAYLVTDLNKLNKKQSVLQQQIGASTGTLGLMPTPTTGDDARLAEVETAYQKALNGVSLKVAPTDVIKALLDLTDHYNFRVNPITTEQWAKHSIGTAIYRILPINFSLEGNLADITQFLRALEDENKYPSLEIENTQIGPIAGQSAEGSQYDTTLQIRISIIERITAGE
jgi:Tfp pilus assembly protein PilO